jgi:hypothetical protein
MLKRKLFNALAAGLLLSAVSAYAAGSVFPSSVSEVGPNWPERDAPNAQVQAHRGASGSVFPSAGSQFGDADNALGATGRTSGHRTIAGGAPSTFPTSPNEAGPILR